MPTSRRASARRRAAWGSRTSSSRRWRATISPTAAPAQFAATIRAVRAAAPAARIEVLTPDFKDQEGPLRTVLAAEPDVFNHNLETVPRLSPTVRPQAGYRRSLHVLAEAKRLRPAGATKSGIMVGLGETPEEIHAVMADLARRRLRSADDRPVSAADARAPAGARLRDARRSSPSTRGDGRALGFRTWRPARSCAAPTTPKRPSAPPSGEVHVKPSPAMDFPRIKRLPPYVFNVVGDLKLAARRAGEDIIDLGMGNPDGPTPPHVVAEAGRGGAASRRTTATRCRAASTSCALAICDWYQRRYGVELDPDTRGDRRPSARRKGIGAPGARDARPGRRRASARARRTRSTSTR